MSRLAGRIARQAALGIGGSAAAFGTGLAVYTNTEQGLGVRREIMFWGSVGPIVFDYWWNLSSSSPKVKLNRFLGLTEDFSIDQNAKKELQQALHKQNAPRIFSVMLNLGGLYIKLGQVLSVTALPIPEEYRALFRTFQSNVPGHEDFEDVVKPTLEREFGCPLDDLFSEFSEIPCGAASIGQAHKARLKDTEEEVIVKVQYPDARWQVPADIDCVGQFLTLCVFFGLVDEEASKLSFEEFSRQFLAELDYDRERENLQAVYESSLNPDAPYLKRGVVIPKPFLGLCTKQIITMTYLPGPKFEEEAKKQLEMLGINTKQGIRSVVKQTAKSHESEDKSKDGTLIMGGERYTSWKSTLSRIIGQFVSVDSIFSMVRFARRVVIYCQATAATGIKAASFFSIVPPKLESWANAHQNAMLQAARLDWTEDAVYALLDIHGYQIFNQGLFNADCHPGNILIVIDENDGTSKHKPKIGLIDYGQCKRLNEIERVKIAKLILSIADKESDEVIADHFRTLGIQTQNDSSQFLAEFGRLMFSSFEPKHLDHSWHQKLHVQDKVTYFPKELSMVYRTSLLLRGLAMSLQFNPSVGEHWRRYAEETVEMHSSLLDKK